MPWTLRPWLGPLTARPDYVLAVASGYTLTAMQMAVQLLLMPLYLRSLSPWQFGVLMMLLSFMNFVAIGIGWMSGGAARLLGEYAASDDGDGFHHAYLVSRLIYTGYAVLAAMAIVYTGWAFPTRLFGPEAQSHAAELRQAMLAAGVYLVVLYDLNPQRLALNAVRRQASTNVLQMVNVVASGVLVLLWLMAGGGLAGIVWCMAAGVAIARIASGVVWARARPYRTWTLDRSRLAPLARRLAGPMGGGFLLYGAFVLVLQADVLIVGLLGGAVVAGQFALVWRIADVLVQLISKLPDHLAPYFVQLDAGGRDARLGEIYRLADRVLVAISLTAGALYAWLGPWLVELWVGAEHAPRVPWAFMLAGGAVFWLGIARLPAILAYTTIRLRMLNTVAAVETGGKVVLTVALFRMFGPIAPLLAINVVHAVAVARAYRRIGRLVT